MFIIQLQMEKDPPQQTSNIPQKKNSNQIAQQKQPHNQKLKATGLELFHKIHSFLTEQGRPFQTLQHTATRTSQQSALIRNTPLEWGAKTMLVKGKESIFLLVYRANRKVSWSKLRKLQCIGKKGSMCGEEQVLNLGVKPGGVPPFAQLLGVKGIIDQKFQQQKMVAFNAGLQNKSIIIATADFPFAEQQFLDFTD